jgi:ATP-dependent Clp protease ATP-binding subunit ClpA
LIKLGQGVAVNVLGKLGLNLETVRNEVEQQVGKRPSQKMIGNIPYTPRVKKVLALASREAKALNHTYVGTEHILLGLLREGDGVAAKVLKNLDVDIEKTRQEILRELVPNFSTQPDGETKNLPSKETASMSSRFEMPQNPEPNKSKQDSIDTSKRYDVYCTERNQEIMVYRNALFKGIKKLYQARQYDFMSEFMELEQADGQTIFLSRSSVIKFCEHGVTPNAETISNKKLPG